MSLAPQEESQVRRDIHLMIAPAVGDGILLMPGEGKWAMPRFDPGVPAVVDVGPVRTWALQALGIELAVLRCVHIDIAEDKKHVEAVLAAEDRGPAWEPPSGGRWVTLAELADLELPIPEHCELIETWLSEENGVAPPQRSPWARRGWLNAVETWIREQMDRLGMAATGPLEQVRTWGISCILRQPTDSDDIYFKAVPTLFAQEPLITEHLSRRFPGHVPSPLAHRVEADQSWMLLRDIGGVVLRGNTLTPAQWDDLLVLLGKIQRATIGDVDDLLSEGCADRRLELLAEQIDGLFSDPDAVGQLNDTEIAKLKGYAPRLKEMCVELAARAIPQTLGHGDFHTGNVSLNDGRYVIFDWTDACITHPFFDLATILNWDVPSGEQAHVRYAYLQGWRDYASEEELAEAYRLAEPLGALHHAVSYRNIVATLEPGAKWEMGGGSTPWLRMLIEWIDASGVAARPQEGGAVGPP